MSKALVFRVNFGKAVMARRKKLGYSRDKLARLMGTDSDYVTYVEEGKDDLHLSEMIIVARALQIPLYILLALAESALFD
ncbi:MAG: helix-turn-helix transcriptional regulator [Armatimonadota bacterium]|nr:helix-turn-helix transcriptional regulator [bacterium]